ncbi:Transcriptional regulator, LacI family [Alteracholeplasma palmae J233]|uniref:Transcriptional regulator, LacI family n=1 Tax=Alteracholeplasma palmae (strain ATCC 49389 / J233) TaxID=1318466 RepID=U4KL89_ALTPJ|nr:LacI family DNA-binding transcriptional regulator [Alteracholeplasma palmae]CCV64533.1 Transcriptional regulator, LacI family [Alteracholeplasma palmae J233]
MVKIKDIAEACQVSIGTVSKALNRSHEISEETTRKIIKKANELGYVANSNARSLKTKRSYSLGIIYFDSTNSGLEHEYFSVMLNGIKKEAEESGYDVVLISNKIGGLKNSYLSHAKYRGCDGVIIVSADFKNPKITTLVESDLPTVTIDHLFHNRTSILSDNVKGLETIVEYLHDKGHKKIAFIHGEDTEVTRNRLASFYRTCQKLKLDIPDSYIKEAQYHIPKYSGLATRELLALEDRPTCIIYPDDYSYLGGLTEIEKHKLKIGEDISVVGYDGIYLSRVLRPVLTTYVQDSNKIGMMAARKLIEMIENPKTYIPEQVVISGYLQQGKTVKTLNSL